MQRSILLVILCLFTCGNLIADEQVKPQTGDKHSAKQTKEQKKKREPADLQDAILDYFSSKIMLGAEHPEAINLRMDVADRLLAREKLNPAKLELALKDSYVAHQKLVRTYGEGHPEVYRNLKKISLVAKLMTYEAEFLEKNWEKIATSNL